MTEDEIRSLPYRDCVGLMILNREGGVFAGQRRDMSEAAWQMPQGGIERGETPRDAALRELEEETGITPDRVEVLAEAPDWVQYDLPLDLVPKMWKGRYRGQRQRWFLLRFLGDDSMIDIATEDPEFSAWAWLTRDELLERIVPFKRPTYQAVCDAFGDRQA